MNMKSTMPAVMSAPLLAGDNIPNMAKTAARERKPSHTYMYMLMRDAEGRKSHSAPDEQANYQLYIHTNGDGQRPTNHLTLMAMATDLPLTLMAMATDLPLTLMAMATDLPLTLMAMARDLPMMMRTIQKIWMPDPRQAVRRVGWRGGRNTSP